MSSGTSIPHELLLGYFHCDGNHIPIPFRERKKTIMKYTEKQLISRITGVHEQLETNTPLYLLVCSALEKKANYSAKASLISYKAIATREIIH